MDLKTNTINCRPTGRKLGKGAFSTVIELTMEENETVMLAGKVFRTSELQTYSHQKLNKEIDIMVELSHSNIVNCKGVCFLPTTMLPVLVMEQMMTSLHAYLLDPDNSNLPLERKVPFLLDTARGLDYLHSRTPVIIHRDLTAKNVLLDSQLRAKISDFGNSRILEYDSGSTSMTTIPGTLAYMPPEAQGEGDSSSTYDSSLDVFSFGHLSLFTLTQTPVKLLPLTYTDSTGHHIRSELDRRGEVFNKAKKILSVYHPLLTVIKTCLCNDPLRRPSASNLVMTIEEILKFPIIRGADITAQTKIELTPDQPLDFHWEDHGFKVHIPAGAISKERGSMTLCIQASLSGDYQLPDDGVLVSGVYWLSLHPTVERFHKKVTVTIQHCASDDDPKLSFITAQCTQKTLPYIFNAIPGRFPSESGYGAVEIEHFSSLAILAQKKSLYAFCTYYISKFPRVCEAHITVTPDLEEWLNVSHYHYLGRLNELYLKYRL